MLKRPDLRPSPDAYGKGRDGQGTNYAAARVHVERIYYFFLFSDEIDPTAYGERISTRLFGQGFFDEFARALRSLGVERPDHLPPSSRVKLGCVEISLGDDHDLLPFRLNWHERPKLVDGEGKPAVYAAMHWRSGLSQLHGRVDEYTKIWNWALDETKLVKTMLISGPGGAGKTRLAFEVMKNLVAKEKWNGGFLLSGFEKNSGVYDGNGAGIIFAIDYPEEKTEAVKDILAAAVNLVTYSKPIRIILVSRESKTDWLNIVNNVELDRFDETPLNLKRCVSTDDALAIANDVETYYPELIGRLNANFLGVEEWLNRNETHRLPLNILAASVHAVLDPSHAFKLDGAEVLTALAEWELRRVRYYSERDLGDRDCLEKLLGLSLLTQIGLIKETVFELGESGICDGKSGDKLFEAVRKTPFWRPKTTENQSHLIKLEPDRPAAVFCLKALRLDDPSLGLPRWLAPPASQDADGFGARLSRIVFDIGHIDTAAGRILEQQCIAMLKLQPALVHQFQDNTCRGLPVFSSAFAAEISHALIADASDDENRAVLLNNYANILSSLGRQEAALDASNEAVAIRRPLAQARRDAFLPNLATSLNNQSNILSYLGRLEAALEAINEAVAIRRQLAEIRPDAFLSDLAISLKNRANRLSDLGQREAALDAINEAVAIFRQLAQTRPDAFQPDLATSLNNQSSMLSDLGRREAALEAINEAVAIRRQLAQARPDAFLPNLATSLNNQSNILSDLGRRKVALEAINEAVAIRRQLAQARPDAFLPDLATSLNNQANRLSYLGRREAALDAINEAVAIRGQLAQARPDAFLPNLATSLNNQSSMLSDLGRREAALDAINEAVTIRRQLAQARPDAFLPNLATSLNNQSNMLSDLGRREAALEAINEAVAIRRQLAQARPDAFLPNLATSVNNQSNMLSNLGRREAALEAINEAVAIRRQLAQARPDAFLPDLATSLNNQSNMLSDLGRREAALDAVNEAVAIHRPLAQTEPDAFLPDLATSLNNQSNRLSDFGRREAALDAINEAVAIRRQLAQARPDAFLPNLAKSLKNQANRLFDLGRSEAALEASSKAMTTLRPIFLKSPIVHRALMANVLSVYYNLCARTSTEPDTNLVQPIVEMLKQMYFSNPDFS